MLMLTLFFACARPAPPPPPPRDEPAMVRVDSGKLADRVTGGDGANFVLFYSSEERGSLEPCGCEKRALGGAARAESYRLAARAADPAPAPWVDVGGWLDDPRGWSGASRPAALAGNRWMATALAAMGVEALNVGAVDVPGLLALGDTGLPLVSANMTVEGVTIAPFLIVQHGDLRVGYTGLAEPPQTPIDGLQARDPLRAGREVLAQLGRQADLIVLMSFHASEAAAKLVRELPIDIVIDAHSHGALFQPFREGHALWVRSLDHGAGLGELRMGLDAGDLRWALERKIDLDPTLPDDPAIRDLTRQAADEIERAGGPGL